MTHETSPLAFNGVNFEIIDRNGQPWLRSPQIAEALGYTQPNRVSDIYTRNADEFTDSMTALVKLQTQGGMQEVRIFSLRGAHLIGMFSRTPRAAAFRRWVLDILESHAPAPQPLPPLPYKEQPGQSLSEPQCAELRSMLTGACAQVPEDMRRQFMVQGWSRLKAHFGCTYRHIPQARYVEALGLVARHCAEYQQLTRQPAALPAPVIDPFDAQAMEAARKKACEWFGSIYRKLGVDPKDYRKIAALNKDAASLDIPDDVLCGLIASSLQSKHFLVNYSWRGCGLQPNITTIDAEALMDFREAPAERIISRIPPHRAPELIAALAQRIAHALHAPSAV